MSPLLGNFNSSVSWAALRSPDFAALKNRDGALAVLPVHGIADHALGLPLDAEEVLGGAVLEAAACRVKKAGGEILVLPPLRFTPAPYPHCFFGVDADLFHSMADEIGESLKRSGFRRILLFNTSPWAEEIVNSAALDLRVKFGLETFFASGSKFGLAFHPAAACRADTRAAVEFLSGRQAAVVSRAADVCDADFRPGCFRQGAAVDGKASGSGEDIFWRCAGNLSEALGKLVNCEMQAEGCSARSAIAPHLDGERSLWRMSRGAIEGIAEKEKAWVILPTAAVEQHGGHLPVGTDIFINEALLGRASGKLPQGARVFVAPPVLVGKSSEHFGFDGTLSISSASLRRLVLAIAGQLREWGFRQLAVFNTHGGNSAVLAHTMRELQGLGMRAGMLAGFNKPADLPEREATWGFHAGEWETSVMLAARPDLVKMERAVCEWPKKLERQGGGLSRAWITEDISKSGVMGDATAASAEKGARWLEAEGKKRKE